MGADIIEIVRHFLRRLRQTPLLLGWLVLGPLVALRIEGWMGLALGLVNIVLAGAYAVLIRWMTPSTPGPVPVRRPRLELAVALGLLGLFLLTQLLDFGVWAIQPWQGWLRGFLAAVYRTVASVGGMPEWALQEVYLAASSTIKQLIPTLLALLLLGYRPGEMGVARPHWKLAALLLGITAVLGLATGILTRAPPGHVLALYVVGIVVNALPEELFFRGFLLPRLERVLGNNPLNALVLSALLFNVLHVPIEISRGTSPLMALLGVVSIGYPSGLIWGYLYLRTRSILPGMLWHAANGNLGFVLIDL
jgi:membrane protease YdiL (CAAX protease family)